MKYEFKLLVKKNNIDGYITKYKVIVNANQYNAMKRCYDSLKLSHPEWDSIVKINELTDFNEFVRAIQ